MEIQEEEEEQNSKAACGPIRKNYQLQEYSCIYHDQQIDKKTPIIMSESARRSETNVRTISMTHGQ